MVTDLCAQLIQGRVPTVRVDNRARSNVELVLHGGRYQLQANEKKVKKQLRSMASILCVMHYVQRLLLTGRTATQREVYYSYPRHFKNQAECNSAILDTARLLGVERESLHLRAGNRGLFAGLIRVTEPGLGVVDGANTPESIGWSISSQWLTNAQVQCEVHPNVLFILVVEKEGVFRQLVEDRFHHRVPCAIITGKGFPDLATRGMVYQVSSKFNLPVLGIADCNPFGLALLLTYKLGSARMGNKFAVDIKWLGLRPSQLQSLHLPTTVRQPLTSRDHRQLRLLMDQLRVEGDDSAFQEYRNELLLQLDLGYKCELEALSAHSFDFLTRIFLVRPRSIESRAGRSPESCSVT